MKLKLELDSNEDFDALVIKFVKSNNLMVTNDVPKDKVTIVNYKDNKNAPSSSNIIESEDESFLKSW